MHLLHRFFALPPCHRWLLLQMGGMLILTGLCLKLFGFRYVFSTLERLNWKSKLSANAALLARILGWTRYAKRHGYGTCLSRSIVLWWLLRRQGIEAELRIGTRKNNAQFQAHAWVEYQGRALNANQTIRQRYHTFNYCFNVSPLP